jgi:uncharacterized membrane protein
VPSYTTSIEIAAPSDRTWAVLSAVSNWPQWAPTVTSVEPLDQRELQVGGRYRLTQPKLGTAVWTVTAVEPGRQFTWESRSSGVRAVASHVVEGTGGPTSAVTLRVALSGPLAFVGSLVAGSLTRDYMQQEAQALKEAAERAVE